MCLLCPSPGLYTPTAGNASIGGYSILTDMDLIRHNLGICPQHNVLFDRLTVWEHLAFFSRLKVWYCKHIVHVHEVHAIMKVVYDVCTYTCIV